VAELLGLATGEQLPAMRARDIGGSAALISGWGQFLAEDTYYVGSIQDGHDLVAAVAKNKWRQRTTIVGEGGRGRGFASLIGAGRESTVGQNHVVLPCSRMRQEAAGVLDVLIRRPEYPFIPLNSPQVCPSDAA
jgi:hypothetical protein